MKNIYKIGSKCTQNARASTSLFLIVHFVFIATLLSVVLVGCSDTTGSIAAKTDSDLKGIDSGIKGADSDSTKDIAGIVLTHTSGIDDKVGEAGVGTITADVGNPNKIAEITISNLDGTDTIEKAVTDEEVILVVTDGSDQEVDDTKIAVVESGEKLTITIKNTILTRVGTTRYKLKFSAKLGSTKYKGNKEYVFDIVVNSSFNVTVVLYTGQGIGGVIGQAMKDALLPDDYVIATVGDLQAGVGYIYTLGNQTGEKVATAEGQAIIVKENIKNTDAASGGALTLTRGIDTVDIAIYKPEEIYVWQDLQSMRIDLAKSYILVQDIEFPTSGTQNFPSAGFSPIGNNTTAFTGTLDGNNKVIRNFYINNNSMSYAGLFGKIQHADAGVEVVKNLGFDTPSVVASNNVGVLAGMLAQGTVSAYITGTGTMVNSKVYVGGLVGSNSNSGTVYGYTTGNVIGSDEVGGLVGSNTGAVYGYTTGNVNGTIHLGGLVGYNNAGTVRGYATGNVVGANGSYPDGGVLRNNRIGGLVGRNRGAVQGYYRGTVVRGNNNTPDTSFGFLAGWDQANPKAVGFYSQTESQFSGITIGQARGTHGTAITIGTGTTGASFTGFSFDGSPGNWTLVNGRWPAINIGIQAASGQSTTP